MKRSVITPIIILFATIIMQRHAAIAQSACNIPVSNFTTNGSVNVSVYEPVNDLIYFGGSFTAINPFFTQGAMIDAASSQPTITWPVVSGGDVLTSVPDGSGGFYIGGSFTTVGGVTRNRIAHINASGQVDPSWDPNASSNVYALAVSGGTVYAGGSFTTIGGQSRSRIAALDATTGAATPWAPDATSGAIYALAVSGDTVYAGGNFTNIGGQSRNRIAAINTASTGTVTLWNPNSNNNVYALAVSGGTIYAGGSFTTIGGQTRNRIAEINTAGTGTVTAWNPDADGEVRTLAISGSTVYAGGGFINIGGQMRNRIAALDGTGAAIAWWNPNANGAIFTLATSITGDTVYAGGNFTNIGGQTRSCIAALEGESAGFGAANAWDPNANNTIRTIAITGNKIYAGGIFTALGGIPRNCIAAFNATTGIVTPWNPQANGTVHALALRGSIVYAGGDFTSIGGQTRNRIAAIDTSSGIVTGWDPNANGTVRAIVTHPTSNANNVFVGGSFTAIGGQTNNYIAKIDTGTGASTTWLTSGANAAVYALAFNGSGSSIYVGGNFTYMEGLPRNRIVEINSTSGALLYKSGHNANGTVNTLVYQGGTLYAGGVFTTIGGQTRPYVAALVGSSGAATSWNPKPNWTVLSIAFGGSTIYIGGKFDRLGGTGGPTRNQLAGIDAVTGIATRWNPDAGNFVNTVTLTGSGVHAGGEFTSMGGNPAFRHISSFLLLSPTIANVSGNTTICAGSNTNFSVMATEATGYQWQVSADTGKIWINAAGGIYSNDTTPILDLTAVTVSENGYIYRCVVTGVCTPADTSVACWLSVKMGASSSQTITVCSGQPVIVGSSTYTVSGIYNDIFTASNGCDSVVTTHLTVKNPITNSQTITVCAGQSVSVGTSTYTASGTYNDTLTATDGCDSTVTTNLTVVDTTTTLNGATITANQNGATYTWIDCDNGNTVIAGETSQSYMPMVNGNYAVIIAISGCADTSSCVNVSVTGLEQIESDGQQLSIYPNPNRGMFTLQSPIDGNYTIVNKLGQTLKSFKLHANDNYSIHMEELSNGIYFIIGINNNQFTKQKIVVTGKF